MKQKLVVIGNGMAGIRTVEELLSAAPNQYEITVFGAEPYGNYNRIMLSAVLAGDKTVEEIVTHPRQWYIDNGITLYAGKDKAVTRIERGLQHVIAQDGTIAEYDRLLIATGSKVVLPDVLGRDLTGVISFRDIADVSAMLQYSQTHRRAVVLGGGLLGLEAANGLVQRGMEQQGTRRALQRAETELAKIEPFDHQHLDEALRSVAEELGLRPREFFGTLRVAVTGRSATPPLFETMEVLGRERVLDRVRTAIQHLAGN